jgi:hypothetical protein
VNGSTTMTGFDDSRVSLTGNQILVNWQGLGWSNGTVVKIDFTFVPEPSSAALLGIAGLAALERRRRSQLALGSGAPMGTFFTIHQVTGSASTNNAISSA